MLWQLQKNDSASMRLWNFVHQYFLFFIFDILFF